MKNDARVRYTKQALRDSLLRCLEGKSISQVTVKEVCDGAELNRATFYNHYRDCYDLLEQLENQMIEEFWDSLHLMSSLNTEKLVSSIMDMIDKNRDLCQVLIFDRGDDSLVRKMVEIAKEQSLELWKRYLTRFTTYEIIERLPLVVVKRDGSRQSFDKIKLINGMVRACEKRPVPLQTLEQIAEDIEQELQSNLEREISTVEIGEMVMDRLKAVDEVAYVRFASVYRSFKDINTFMEELSKLLTEK